MTAAALAEELEVTVRTIYRDVGDPAGRAACRSRARAGVGYVLRKGFDLPPLMFTIDEIEAIAVGARLVRRAARPELQQAADARARQGDGRRCRNACARPCRRRAGLCLARHGGRDRGRRRWPQVRAAIRDRRKLRIAYVDEKGRRTRRTIWPLAMAYYVDVTAGRRLVRAQEGPAATSASSGIAASRVLAAQLPGSQRTEAGRMAGAAQGSARDGAVTILGIVAIERGELRCRRVGHGRAW